MYKKHTCPVNVQYRLLVLIHPFAFNEKEFVGLYRFCLFRIVAAAVVIRFSNYSVFSLVVWLVPLYRLKRFYIKLQPAGIAVLMELFIIFTK